MTTFLIIIGSLLMAAAVVASFRPWMVSAPLAWLGIVALWLTGMPEFNWGQMLFWGVAAAIVVGLDRMLPKAVSRGQQGRGYIAGGALAGMVVGMLLYTMAGVILGSALGALLGAIAYSRTPSGKVTRFPSSQFFNFLAARGLPAVVTFSMVGFALLGFMSRMGANMI